MDKSLKSRWLVVAVVALLSCVTCISCGDDDDGLKNSNLIGTWQNQAFIYQFDKDGSGYFQYSPYNGVYDVWGDTKSYYKWSATSNMLSITYDGSGPLSAGTLTYYYEVDTNLLVLINMNSGDTSSFTRK